MNIVVIGTGAREHAIAWKLHQHAGVQLYNYGPTRNPGIVPLCQSVGRGSVTDIPALVQWCQEQHINVAWIGPEAPLVAGVVNALEAFGIACIGPTKKLSRLESSKSFTRQLLEKYDIAASPIYQVFTNMTGIEDFVAALNDQVVVKPDGLTGGKGVRVMGDHFQKRSEVLAYCQSLFAAGDTQVVLEEKLVGQEFSLLSLSDGRHLIHLPIVQDHKRVQVGDRGPNTGGMGSYSDANHSLPFLNDSDLATAHRINEQALQAIQEECGEEYKGVLYGGFMAVRDDTKLIEFNVRFGDPEVMNLLAVLQTDFVTVTEAIIHRTLNDITVKFLPLASVCKYVVPQGYPDQPVQQQIIDVSAVDQSKVQLFYGAVEQTDRGLELQGSRAIGVVGVGDSIAVAEQLAEEQIQRITGPVFHRSDIGTAALIQSRVNMLRQLRHS